MRRRNVFAYASALALIAAPAITRADVLASGPLFVGSSVPQQLASCYLFNAGATAVALSAVRIVSASGAPIALVPTSLSCGATLAAGQQCRVEGGILSSGPYACTVTTPAGAGTLLRGTFQLGNAGDNPAAATTPLLLTETSGLGGPPPCKGRPGRGREHGCKPNP